MRIWWDRFLTKNQRMRIWWDLLPTKNQFIPPILHTGKNFQANDDTNTSQKNKFSAYHCLDDHPFAIIIVSQSLFVYHLSSVVKQSYCFISTYIFGFSQSFFNCLYLCGSAQAKLYIICRKHCRSYFKIYGGISKLVV